VPRTLLTKTAVLVRNRIPTYIPSPQNHRKTSI